MRSDFMRRGHAEARNVLEAIDRGMDGLTSLQSPDGSFPLERSSVSGSWVEDHPIFATTNVLWSVGGLLDERHRHLALEYVLSQQKTSGLWTFDDQSDLPADADDTACALACLSLWHSEWLGSYSTRTLLAPFIREGGRIATWLTPRGDLIEGQDADDVVVVANVLSALAIEDANIARQLFVRWREGCWHRFDSGACATPYYCLEGNVLFAWRRAASLMGTLWPSFAPVCGTTCLSMAFAISLGAAHLVPLVLALQDADGTWPRESWCSSPGATFGSRAVTSAFVLEALNSLRESDA
jgi:hypothetical protein